jgi:RimJ/RimL family protein N-acetyltransferase
MHITTEHIVIRAFSKDDAENLHAIAREADIYRFMPDWADEFPVPQDYYKLIEWFQEQQDTTDIAIGRRYAVTLPETNEMIGMVGVGLGQSNMESDSYFYYRKYNA